MRKVNFELDGCGIEATLVYYIEEYPEGMHIHIDQVYYGYGKNKHDMSFLIDNKKFYESMVELSNEDCYENA